MTIQELIDQLQDAMDKGYKSDTRICIETGADVMGENTYWGICLDTGSSGYPKKSQWKIAIAVYEED